MTDVKIPGTRFSLILKYDNDKDDWIMSLQIGSAVEEKISVNSISVHDITESVEKLVKSNNVQINPFQLEMISKDLYAGASGDTDLSKHEEDMEEIEKKKEMMQDGSFQNSIVSEYKDQYKIKDNNSKQQQKQQKHKKSDESEWKTVKQKQKVPEREKQQIQKNIQSSEMKEMVSEINKNLTSSQPKASQSSQSDTKNTGPDLRPAESEVDTRVSSVDIEDLVNELMETKRLLKLDIDKVNQRMEKIDKLIWKISSISSKL